MATKEFIEKRVEGKKKEIEKLTKKLDRILKAKATNWEVNPYYYHEDDLRWTTRDLEAAKEALAKYEAELVSATEKENSRNVTVILEFLAKWKVTVRKFYEDSLPRYLAAKEDLKKELDEIGDEWIPNYKEMMTRDEKRRAVQKAFKETWNYLAPYIERGWSEDGEWRTYLNTEKLQKDLDNDANAKYDDIIERTNEITGTITDAGDLHIGEKGDLNGYIIGERGTAKVNTIGAGGYNIQCYHFRCLIHRVK